MESGPTYKQGNQTSNLAPLQEVDAKKPQIHFNLSSLYGDMGSQHSIHSQDEGLYGDMRFQHSTHGQDEGLKELPQYTRDHKSKSKLKVLPFVRGKPNGEKDTRDLFSLLSTLIECRLTLKELFRVHPYLWNDLADIVAKMGIKGIHPTYTSQQSQRLL